MIATGVPGPDQLAAPRREHLHDARRRRAQLGVAEPHARRDGIGSRAEEPRLRRLDATARRAHRQLARLGSAHVGFRRAQRLVRGGDHLLLHVQRGRRPLELLRRQPAARRQLGRAPDSSARSRVAPPPAAPPRRAPRPVAPAPPATALAASPAVCRALIDTWASWARRLAAEAPAACACAASSPRSSVAIGWPAFTSLPSSTQSESSRAWTVGVTTISFASTTPISTRSCGRERTNAPTPSARTSDAADDDEDPLPLGHSAIRGFGRHSRRWLLNGSSRHRLPADFHTVKLGDNVL